eukprot:2109455-Rhodomonas_salina.2
MVKADDRIGESLVPYYRQVLFSPLFAYALLCYLPRTPPLPCSATFYARSATFFALLRYCALPWFVLTARTVLWQLLPIFNLLKAKNRNSGDSIDYSQVPIPYSAPVCVPFRLCAAFRPFCHCAGFRVL